MEDVNTTTPVITEEQGEQGEQGEQREQGKQEGQREQGEQEGQKENKWIPRYRLNEKNVEIEKLNKQISELQGLKEKAEVYDSLLSLINENPAYAEELNQLYQKHFGEKNQISGLDEEYENENLKPLRERLERLEVKIRNQEIDNLQREWNVEIQEINQDAKKRGITLSETDIYKLMDTEKLSSPKQAYKWLLGNQIDSIYGMWESNLKKKITNQKEQFPSFPSSSRSVRKPASSIEEAFNFLKT